MPKVTIDNFSSGASKNLLTGFARMQNVDLERYEGAVTIQTRTDAYLSGLSAIPTAIDYDTTNGDIYTAVSDTIYKNTTDLALSANLGTIKDLRVWKNYAWVTTNTNIEVYGPLDSSLAQVPTAVDTGLNGGVPHPIAIDYSEGDVMYIGNGKYIATVSGVTEQVAGTTPTHTVNLQALDLPDGEVITTIIPYGLYIVVGTESGRLYPWDRVSSSFNIPAEVGERINSITKKDGLLYVQAGRFGHYYATNLSSVTKVFEPPIRFLPNEGVIGRPNASEVLDGELLFGLSGTSRLNDTSADSDFYQGVYSFKDGRVSLRNIVSSGGEEATVSVVKKLPVQPGSTLPELLIGWQDGTSRGVDRISASGYKYTSYSAVVESPFIQVGTAKSPSTFQKYQINFLNKLQTGHGVKMYYRTSISDDWTLVETIENSVIGAKDSYHGKFSVTDITDIQIKVEMTTGANSTTAPIIREIILE